MLIAILSLLSCWLPPPSNPLLVRYQRVEQVEQRPVVPEQRKEEQLPGTTTPTRGGSGGPTTYKKEKSKKTVIRSIKPPRNTPLLTILDEQESVCTEADDDQSQLDYDPEDDTEVSTIPGKQLPHHKQVKPLQGKNHHSEVNHDFYTDQELGGSEDRTVLEDPDWHACGGGGEEQSSFRHLNTTDDIINDDISWNTADATCSVEDK